MAYEQKEADGENNPKPHTSDDVQAAATDDVESHEESDENQVGSRAVNGEKVENEIHNPRQHFEELLIWYQETEVELPNSDASPLNLN